MAGMNLSVRLSMISVLVVLAYVAGQTPVMASDGIDLLNSRCAGCHALNGSAPATLSALWARKGPDLFYAGNKYKAQWLKQWLQNPVRIRPAGMFYARHIKPGEERDEVDDTSLEPHPVLSAQEAEAVTGTLMNFKAKSELIKPGDYQAGTISIRMGELMFDKFRGCLACHQIEPGYGGLSGPEMYTAARRLQEDYLISFMRNPRAWDPKTFMPARRVKETDLQKFVHYFRVLSQENFK